MMSPIFDGVAAIAKSARTAASPETTDDASDGKVTTVLDRPKV